MSNTDRHPECHMRTALGNCDPIGGFCTSVNESICEALHKVSRPQAEWIPCSERLPEEDGRYLVRFSDDWLDDYSDFTEIEIATFEVDCEGFGYWTDRFDPISLGFVDCDWIEFPVIAWQPLPEPYETEQTERSE